MQAYVCHLVNHNCGIPSLAAALLQALDFLDDFFG